MALSYSWNDLVQFLKGLFPEHEPVDFLNALDPSRAAYAEYRGHMLVTQPSRANHESTEHDWIFDAIKNLAVAPPSRAQAIVLGELYQHGRPALQREAENILIDRGFLNPVVSPELKADYRSVLLETGQNIAKTISSDQADKLMDVVMALGKSIEDEVALNCLFCQCKDDSLQIFGRQSLLCDAFESENPLQKQLSQQAVSKLERPKDSYVSAGSFDILRNILKESTPYCDAMTSWKDCTTNEGRRSLENDYTQFLNAFHRLHPNAPEPEKYQAFLLTDTDILHPLLHMAQLPSGQVSTAAWKNIGFFGIDIAYDVNQQKQLIEAALNTKPAGRVAALDTIGKIFDNHARRAIYTIEQLVDRPLSGELGEDFFVNCLIGRLAGRIAPQTLSNETMQKFSTRVLQVAVDAIPLKGDRHVRLTSPLVYVAKAMIAKGNKKDGSMPQQKAAAKAQYQTAVWYIDKTLSDITRTKPTASDRYIDARIAVVRDMRCLVDELPKSFAETLKSTDATEKWLSACTEAGLATHPKNKARVRVNLNPAPGNH